MKNLVKTFVCLALLSLTTIAFANTKLAPSVKRNPSHLLQLKVYVSPYVPLTLTSYGIDTAVIQVGHNWRVYFTFYYYDSPNWVETNAPTNIQLSCTINGVSGQIVTIDDGEDSTFIVYSTQPIFNSIDSYTPTSYDGYPIYIRQS